jgi:glyoxylase-like metal-dependent hydrolase (beta-lactamase superfamily II)
MALSGFMNPSASSPWSRREVLKWLSVAGGSIAAANLFTGKADSSQPGGGEPPAPEKKPEAAAKPDEPKSPPPGLAGEQAGYYRFKIGSLDAVALFDGGMNPPSDKSPFGVDEPPGAVAGALDAAWLPKDRVQIPFNVLLVRAGADLVLIDSGCGPHLGESGGKMFAAMSAIGVKPEHITGIILTHAHRDHFGGLLDAEKRPVFPQAKLFVGKKEHEFWMASSPDLSGMAVPPDATKEFVTGAQTALGAYKDRVQLVSAGDRLLDNFEMLDTPGHTPGHLAVVIGSGKDALLHIGDVAIHQAIGFAHPGWRYAYDADPALAVETRRKLFDRASAERLRIFGAHVPFPGLGRVKKVDGAYAFLIEPFAVA